MRMTLTQVFGNECLAKAELFCISPKRSSGAASRRSPATRQKECQNYL
jgi:hypothetical protein